MITRKIRIQLVVLLLIAVVGITYTGARYAGLDRLFGAGGYHVTVRLADAGGLEPNAEVTDRGVAVGQVESLRVVGGGVVATVLIRSSAPPIPADTLAVVTNRSAIGEQNIDLQPAHAAGPYLREGSTIERDRTVLPPAPDQVLTNLDQLVADVPTDALRTTVTELGRGFAGAGPPLAALIDGSSDFLRSAQVHLPATTSLLHNATTVLRTQQDQSADILEFSRGLRQISAQLKKSDPDLRTIINDAPRLTDEVRDVVNRTGPPLSDLLDHGADLSRIIRPRVDNIEFLLISYPMMTALSGTLSPDSKAGRLAFVLPFFDPPSCTRGYEHNRQRQATDFGPVRTDPKLACAVPKGSTTGVRGSQNAPNHGGW